MNRFGAYAELSSAGLGLFASVLIGIWAGQWLDSILNTSGIFTVIMMFLGFAGAMLNLLRVVRKFSDKRNEK